MYLNEIIFLYRNIREDTVRIILIILFIDIKLLFKNILLSTRK